jgi:hypothetical protein
MYDSVRVGSLVGINIGYNFISRLLINHNSQAEVVIFFVYRNPSSAISVPHPEITNKNNLDRV